MRRSANTSRPDSLSLAAPLRAAIIAALVGAAGGESLPDPIEVFVGETKLTAQGGMAHAPLNASSIQFQVTPPSQRVRYRLEGVGRGLAGALRADEIQCPVHRQGWQPDLAPRI